MISVFENGIKIIDLGEIKLEINEKSPDPKLEHWDFYDIYETARNFYVTDLGLWTDLEEDIQDLLDQVDPKDNNFNIQIPKLKIPVDINLKYFKEDICSDLNRVNIFLKGEYCGFFLFTLESDHYFESKRFDYDKGPKKLYSISYIIFKDFRNKGILKKSLEGIMPILNNNFIYLIGCREDNIPSIKIIEKYCKDKFWRVNVYYKKKKINKDFKEEAIKRIKKSNYYIDIPYYQSIVRELNGVLDLEKFSEKIKKSNKINKEQID